LNREIINRADQLLELVQAGKAAAVEYDELLQLMEAHPEPWFIAHIQTYFSTHPGNVPQQVPSSHNPAWQAVLRDVMDADKAAPVQTKSAVIRRMRTWYAAAAAVAVVVAVGFLVWRDHRDQIVPTPAQQLAGVNIEPGREGAILTLEDGSTVVLDSLGNGLVSSQSGSKVMLQNGQLAYEAAGNESGRVAWNNIATPKARQFRLTLEDGTRVWLNAASSLRYPTAFNGSERKVQLTGEAYFEVAKNAKQPFRVAIGDSATVEVLGTSFNINAYTDEPVVRTTLLDGSVRVAKHNDVLQLQPGQQAVMQQHIFIDNTVNIHGEVSWKDGKFNFDGASLEEFMRQLSRWYDIEVAYKGRTPKMRIRGKADRDLPLQELLGGLGDLGVRYEFDGRKLIIQ
jgi:transmembrane sensor